MDVRPYISRSGQRLPLLPGREDGSVTDRGPVRGDRVELECKTALLYETLQLANYSAITHLIVAIAIACFFWDVSSRLFLVTLVASIGLVISATLGTTIYFRNSFKVSASELLVRRGLALAKCFALALGIAWGSMAAILVGSSENGHRLIAVATTAGLIADAYAVGPIFSVSLLLVTPIVLGALIGLQSCEAPFGAYLALLLTIYAAFVFLSTRRMSVLSYQRVRDRVAVREQGETIGLLLNEFEEGASDWLWETDVSGRLCHVSPRMASTLARAAEDLQGILLEELLQDHVRSPSGQATLTDLVATLKRQEAFRDSSLQIETAAGSRWWSLNGKPYSDGHGRFAGYRGVGSDITRDREAEARITYLANNDLLTNLANRRAFHDELSRTCGELADGKTCLLYLDLDGFKAVNDASGHGTGDRLLQEVSCRLLELAHPRCRVFRIGGDEFAVICSCQNVDEAEKLARRIVERLSAPFLIEGSRFEIGVSVGLAIAPDDASEPAILLGRADLALYEAKNTGRGCWRRFDPAFEERATRRRHLDRDMREALAAGELDLHYQPVIQLRDGRVVGFEALLRWFKPGHGWISPSEIIPIAESTGFIIDIGRWALKRACTDVLQWPGKNVAVNISSMHFRMQRFHEEVREILSQVGLDPNRLEIEITESVLLDASKAIWHNFTELQKQGIRLALDDFGTGYSSLSYLTRFPFDKIKIDQSFVRELSTRPRNIAIIDAIAHMAESLSMEITVEGVETRDEADALKLTCGMAQGYLYSAARPADQVPGLIARLERAEMGSALQQSEAAA